MKHLFLIISVTFLVSSFAKADSCVDMKVGHCDFSRCIVDDHSFCRAPKDRCEVEWIKNRQWPDAIGKNDEGEACLQTKGCSYREGGCCFGVRSSLNDKLPACLIACEVGHPDLCFETKS